jgi:hypothetical protein
MARRPKSPMRQQTTFSSNNPHYVKQQQVVQDLRAAKHSWVDAIMEIKTSRMADKWTSTRWIHDVERLQYISWITRPSGPTQLHTNSAGALAFTLQLPVPTEAVLLETGVVYWVTASPENYEQDAFLTEYKGPIHDHTAA